MELQFLAWVALFLVYNVSFPLPTYPQIPGCLKAFIPIYVILTEENMEEIGHIADSWKIVIF